MRSKFGKRRFALAALAALGAGFGAPAAQACGGFFCSVQQPVNQAAEKIVFADNGDGTITAVIQILYEGPSENFSWLLPISTVPQPGDLDIASELAFQRLQQATNPLYTLSVRTEGTCRSQFGDSGGAVPGFPSAAPETCADNQFLAGCNGSPSGSVDVAASGVVGAFEWTALALDPTLDDPAAAAVEWLTRNGYDVPDTASGLLRPYLADGMYLLALRLTKGSDTGSIRPIVLTYQADAPMIPIKLTALAANDDMGVMTWALSGSRAVPFNYNALELNEARIDWFTSASNYNQVVIEAADAAGGQGFVTEFAGSTNALAQVVWSDSDEANWTFVRDAVYSTFNELFDNTYSSYGSYDGFWDAVKKGVTLPAGISESDFKSCPTCYPNAITLAPTAYFAALEADVIEPMRRVQQLIDGRPYVTRLYSTLSAGDMTLDPVFVFNPDLPDVSNTHTAERVIECNSDVFDFEAPWRIELPQGGIVRGSPETLGTWPDATAAQPANLRVLTLAASGSGEVLVDNSGAIDGLLAAYNGTQPGGSTPAPVPDANNPAVIVHDGGCALGGQHSVPTGALFAGLAALVAVRRRRVK